MKHRGIYRIDEEQLARLLKLPAGQHVTSVTTSFERLSVLIMVEGEGLPEVHPGTEPPIVGTLDGPYPA
ncbi:hypothetical protein GCM10010172_06540 [Paractinoplanes ferrugineus]|uniref:Uncharacterized protein n=1 Tax=Paractinoplanes ferrugineus TaxID=113564 RepID=A0A919JAY9_9ACTN|nr:hypothetical protein [Actinoplanes ferrugineus]GIE16318.1 hypothetical protein Afe05nite_81580 [Actinoplanes ferrugineus]